jgi:hypothetical protein
MQFSKFYTNFSSFTFGDLFSQYSVSIHSQFAFSPCMNRLILKSYITKEEICLLIK